MKVLPISKNQFKKMQLLDLPSSVLNTESQLFIYDVKENWETNPKLFKIFHNKEGEYFANKQAVINTLDYCREQLDIGSLILPEKKVIVANEEVGYSMPFISNNINLSVVLGSEDLDFSQKIYFLKEIGKILESINNIKELENEFFLGDLHEGNFIYDFNDEKLKVVDLDSCKIKSSYPFESKYLVTNKNLNDKKLKHKYQKNFRNVYIPNKNTDYLCYTTIILNTIGMGSIEKLSMKNYYSYMQHLIDNGFPKELVDEFAKIYIPAENTNLLDYLQYLPEDVDNVRLDDFYQRVRKK